MSKLSNFLSKYFKYLVAAAIIVVPLYPKFPFIRIPGTYVSIRFEDFLMAAIAAFALVKIVTNIKAAFKDEIIRSMGIFVLVGSVSLLAGVFLTQTVVMNVGLLHLLRRVEYFIPFFAIFAFFPQERTKNLEFYIKTLMLTVFLVFIYGLGQVYLDFPVIMTQNSESSKGVALSWVPGSQLASTFAGHYDLAAYMVLVLPIFISLIFTVKGRVAKVLLGSVSLFGFWLLSSSASRISLVSYLIAVSISLFLLKKYKAIVAVVIISLILSTFSSNLSTRYKSLINVYIQRVKNVKVVNIHVPSITVLAKDKFVEPTPTPAPVIEDRSTSIRLDQEWPRAIRAFIKSPLIGTGYSSIGLATDNDYLRLLAEIGFLGFAAFMLVITRILMVFVHTLPLTKKLTGLELGFVAGVIGGIIGTMVTAVFIDVFEASKFAITFWLLVGLAVYVAKNSSYANKN